MDLISANLMEKFNRGPKASKHTKIPKTARYIIVYCIDFSFNTYGFSSYIIYRHKRREVMYVIKSVNIRKWVYTSFECI